MQGSERGGWGLQHESLSEDGTTTVNSEGDGFPDGPARGLSGTGNEGAPVWGVRVKGRVGRRWRRGARSDQSMENKMLGENTHTHTEIGECVHSNFQSSNKAHMQLFFLYPHIIALIKFFPNFIEIYLTTMCKFKVKHV